MKKRFQRLISFALVLVMLVTMIPAGIFTAIAETETETVSSELAAGLANIAGTSEFVINTVADWNAVAATNNQFDGKTVKLGADIDAEGATLPQLFQAGNARCTFDGQNFTIKNVGTAEAPNPTSLLSWKSNLNVQNLTLDNCYVAGEGDKGLLVDWYNLWSTYTLKNIKVFNSSVTSTNSAAGALVGYVSGNGQTYCGINFENILVSGTSVTATTSDFTKKADNSGYTLTAGSTHTGAGALVGFFYWNANDKGVSAKNIEVLNIAISDNGAAPLGESLKVPTNAAGLFGYVRMHKNVALSIENAYVNATFQLPGAGGWTGVNTALFQTANTSVVNNNQITLKNCITNCTYANGVVQSTTLFYAPQAIFTASKLYSVQDRNMEGMLVNGGNTVNGVAGLVSGYQGVPAEIIAAASIPMMITRDQNGFVSKVEGLSEDNTVFPNYDTTSEFVINSIEDWEKISSSHKTFTGKTIKLAADIDAEGNGLPLLIYTLTPSGVTFDGQGHTIKNVGTESSPISGALIAYSLSGATVKNVTFENIHVASDAEAAIVATCVEAQGDSTTKIERIKIANSSVLSNASNAGAVVAKVTDKNANDVITFNQINIDKQTTVTGNLATGGVIGTARHLGILNISNILSSATVTGTSTNSEPGYDLSVGGLVGYSYSDGSATINVNDCMISSSLNSTIQTNSGEAKGPMHLGGTIGYSEGSFPAVLTNEDGSFAAFDIEGGGRTLNVKRVVINCDFSSNARHRSLIANYKAVGFFNYENVYTTKNSAMWQLVNVNHWVILNGKQTNGELGASEETIRDDIILVVPYVANRMRNFDEDGFMTGLDSVVEPYGYQRSEVVNGKYSVRFLGTANLIDEQTVMMNVKATTASGAVRTFSVTSPLFERVTAFDKHQIMEEDLVALRLENPAEKLVCVTVYDIPVGEAIEFEISVQILTAQGKVIESTKTMTFAFDANGAPATAIS